MADKVFILESPSPKNYDLNEILLKNGFKAEVVTDISILTKVIDGEEACLIVNDPESYFLKNVEFLENFRERFPGLSIIILNDTHDVTILCRLANLGISAIFQSTSPLEKLVNALEHRIDPNLFCVLDKNPKSENNHFLEIKGYPDVTSGLSDASFTMKESLEKLHSMMLQGNIIFIYGPPGTEFNKIYETAKNWFNLKGQFYSYPKDSLNIISTDLDSQKNKNAIGILLEKVIPESSNLDTLVKEIQNKINKESYCFFFANTKESYKTCELGNRCLIESHLVEIPPLKERLNDLAHYTKKFIGDRNLSWTIQALNALFQYAWPQNYNELSILFSDNFFAELKGNLIELKNIQQHLPGINISIPQDTSQFSLENFLIQKQIALTNKTSSKNKLIVDRVDYLLLKDCNENEDLLYPSLVTNS